MHERLVQGPAGGRRPGQLAFPGERREVGLGAVRGGQVEVPVRVLVAAVQVAQPGLGPRSARRNQALLHVGHVPDQAKQGERRGRHGPLDEFLAGQALAFGQQRAPVVVLQPALQGGALARHCRRVGPGALVRRGQCDPAHAGACGGGARCNKIVSAGRPAYAAGVAEAQQWDVLIVGAGSGRVCKTQRSQAAAARGARTLVALERAAHPRYKTCGGGLIGFSLRGGGRAADEVPALHTSTSVTVDNARAA